MRSARKREKLMATLTIHDRTGAEVGKYEIDPDQIAPRISKQLIHDAVVMYQNNLRLGTVRTKNRSDVAGTTKKMYRQKGTGNARAGSRRSGIRRGGGHIHAIRPRDWSYRLTKKALQIATRMALASRIADNEVTLIDQFAFPQPKTRDAAAILKALKLDGKTVLVALPGYDSNVHKSVRNLADVVVLPVSELNALNILKPRRLLMTTSALDVIRNKTAKSGRNGSENSESPNTDAPNTDAPPASPAG
jgi:large subunit ribosomal protein L4